MFERRRLLVWGKTYPEWSKSHYETVCTGAVDEQSGRLIRIYPITLRFMGKGGVAGDPFRKYEWIVAEVERNDGKDYRPESYRINQQSIVTDGHIPTDKPGGWEERRRWVLGQHNVFRSVEDLWDAQEADRTSLGLVRPKTIKRFYDKKKPPDARAEWDEARERALAQRDLFIDAENAPLVKELRFMPIQYRVEFECDDERCKGHDMSILDWELYALHRKVFADKGAVGARNDVIQKLEQSTDSSKRDVFFFLGNTAAHPHNFMVVGLFTPPLLAPKREEKKSRQTALDFG